MAKYVCGNCQICGGRSDFLLMTTIWKDMRTSIAMTCPNCRGTIAEAREKLAEAYRIAQEKVSADARGPETLTRRRDGA